MPHSDNHKAKILPVSHFCAGLVHWCRVGMQPRCRDCSASLPVDGQPWPQSGPNLSNHNRNVIVSDHAVFIVSEGMTKAMNNPFHICLAPHKSHNSALNLQERTELCFQKNMKKETESLCISKLGKTT